MASLDRQTLLKLAAGAFFGLLLLDYVVFEPALGRWKDQSERIAALQKKVDRGNDLIKREDRLRNVWASMQRSDLSPDQSAADAAVYTAVSRWQANSGVATSIFTPSWQSHEEEGYDAYECRMAMTGDQIALAKFLYNLGTDPLPCSLEECEILTRDAHGQQLGMTARFSFVHVSSDIFAGLSTGARSNGSSKRGATRDE